MNKFSRIARSSCNVIASPERAKQSLTRIAAISIPLLLLSACGDDITEINANVGAVKTSDDLPECTEDIAGQTAFIKETHEFLGCDGKEWQTLSANTVSVGDNVCTSTSLSDGTGFEIFCNGASIGTVKNGKDGTDGKDGANGKDGEPGAAGKDGADGQKGDTGAKGDKGDDGAPGTNGTNGTNGKDGAPGADGTGCRILESTELTATIACGSETFTMDLTGYVDIPEECDPSDEGCAVQMDDVELSGVSQKGPFVSGTDVTAYELENGKSLKQTGKTFGGKIENKDGSFNIRTVKLKSSFAYLVADGFYRNEVTGRNSSATIKLRALTNLDGRSTANINLVTHLEYDRVQRLVTKENKSVIEAKRAAEKSLFAAFNIDNTGFKGFAEDLNIFKEGDGNAALLAVSAMLQGDRNESELTALLAAFSVDLGDNGVWDDSLQRAKIADWAMKADIEGRLATIRANVEGWKLSNSKAPAFEGHVTNFWTTELGVPACTADGAGKLFATKNVNSAYYAKNDSAFTEGDSSLVRLICDASGTAPAWRFATEMEKDTAALSAELPEDTAVVGKINTGRVYVKESGNWRRGTQLDIDLAKSCVGTIKNTTTFNAVSTDTTWYICVNDNGELDGYTVPTSWRKATNAEADTAQFGVPECAADSIKRGHINRGYFFVYEDGWRRGTENDLLLKKACLGNMVNKVYKINNQFYTCTDEAKIQPDGAEVATTWRVSTAEEADNYFTETPEQEGTVKQGDLDSSRVYVYEVINEKGIWRRGTSLDLILGKGCIASKVDSIIKTPDNRYYTCTAEPAFDNGVTINNTWRASKADEADKFGWTAPAGTGDSVRTGNIDTTRYYVYEGDWRFGTYLDDDAILGPCTNNKLNKVAKSSNNVWYKCVNDGGTLVGGKPVVREWRMATDYEMDTYGLPSTVAVGTDTMGLVNKNLLYVKESYGWRPATVLESYGLGACTEKQEGSIKSFDPENKESWYKCTNENVDKIDTFKVDFTWRKATNIEKDTLGWGRNYAEGKFKNGKVNDNMTYVFESNKWRHGTSLDSSLGLACISTRNDLLRVSGGIWYKCKGDTAVSVDGATLTSVWRKATALEVDTKYWMENKDSTGKLLLGSKTGTTMVWDNESLREASETEIKLGKACVSYKYGQTDSLANTLKYSCSRLGWSTIGKFYDMREWITYKAVLIGNQTWMAQNLQYTTANSRYYDNKMDNVIKYGLLYTWTDALNVCPSGWHLPTKAEWDTLYAYVGGSNVAGAVLKSQSDWAQHGNGSDAYSFTVIPSGAWMSGTYGGYMGEEIYACIWSSTEHNSNSNNAYTASFGFDSDEVSGSEDKNNACSVRCINDIKL